MTFADRLIAGDSWAIDMIDAVGKPGPGIKKGLTYFIGSYDQCLAVDAHVQKNDSLGEFDDADDVSFGGRYCRASFGLPVSLIRAVVGEYENNTHGIPLRLTWGLCLPTSCHKDDVEGLLNLGLLAMFNVSAERVVCQEDQDLPNDKPAQAVIGVLGGLLLLVILSSAIELLYLGRSSGSKVPKSDDAYVMSKIHQDNTDFSSKNNVYDHMYDWRQSALARAQLKLNDEPKAELNLEEEPKTERRSKEEPVEGLNNGQAKTDEQTTARLSVGSYDSVNSATYNKAEQLEIADDTADVKLIRSFSIFTNAPRLMSTETRPDDIPTLYGIRVLSMLWVMLGNTYIYTVISVSDAPVAANLMDTFAVMKRFTFQVVLSASFATDTFFVISGCLTAYWYLTKLEISTRKVNVKTWLKFYLGKYCTLTPPYMLVMGTFVTLYMYLGHGPIWPESLNNAEHCMTDWWRHLFYVNNFVGVDGVMPEDQCMAWSWYLAVNMQFYLISPIMLTFMSFSTSMGLALTGILAVAGIVTAGVKESHYGGDLLSSRLDGGAYWNNVFTTPWCRVGAYCVGLALGCVLCKWYDKKMKKLLAAFIWLVSVCVGVLLVYITFTKYVDNAGDWTRAQQSAYESLGRPAWALCVAWVVYASSMGFAGPIGDLLSWKGFVPLSRMTYLVYLFHPILMVLVVYSRRSLVYIDDFQMSYLYLGHVVVCYGAAFVACLVFESPFRNIIKTIQGKSLNSP